MNALNYVRTINGLAEQSGLSERINIAPDGMEKKDIDYFAAIKKNLSFYEN